MTTQMKVITAKRGDTFRLECTWTDTDGSPRSLSGVSVESWLSRGGSVVVLSYEEISEVDGEFSLEVPSQDIDDLRVGPWLCDVEFTTNGNVESTETFMVSVVPDVTNAP